MSSSSPDTFFSAILSAGSVLAGFCGTFLSFRIQREASYFQQPVLNWEPPSARNVPIRMTHFTGALLLLCLGTLLAAAFGVVFPLVALAGVEWALGHQQVAVGGLMTAMVLVAFYFVAELIHYEVLKWEAFKAVIQRPWGGKLAVVLACIAAVSIGMAVWAELPRP